MTLNTLKCLKEDKLTSLGSPQNPRSPQRLLGGLACVLALTGCTGQVSGSFRYAQQVEAFSSNQDVNTKIDLLWVVDNSSSMDVSQSKLRQGFQSFANRYLKPTWDIRVAVITTDTYLANSAFSNYLSTVVPTSVGYTSTYLASRLATLTNPSWNPTLVDLSTGTFTNGFTFGNQVPAWGPNFAKLLPGNHDGPLATLCFEPMPYFKNGVTDCAVRDDQTGNTGVEACINPGSGESSLSQCVNTIQNDTVHSGKTILTTMPPTGVSGDAAWTTQLVRDFMVNASTGSSGSGSERGISSVLQLLQDNEGTSTALFRANSLRGIIFLSDEDDQSMTLPSTIPAGFKPFSGYGCDQNELITLNGVTATTGTNGICCTGANNCSYPTPVGTSSVTTTCTPKTVDGYTYTPTICADESQLISVADAKSTVDQFFTNLDGSGSAGDPNYFVSVITPTTATAIQSLQSSRTSTDGTLGLRKSNEVSRGDRYIAFSQLVSSDSLALDISSADYSPILEAIGRQIISKKSTFTLSRAPTTQEEMIVKIQHADGTQTTVSSSNYTINGNQVVFSDEDLVLSFLATDQIVVDYQPRSAS